MENIQMLLLTEDFFGKIDLGVDKGNFYAYSYGTKISHHKIRKVRKKYAPFDLKLETPLLLMDDSVFRNASVGFLITNTTLYYRLWKRGGWPKKGHIKLESINQIYIQCNKWSSFLYVNMENLGEVSSFKQKWPCNMEAEVLNKLLEKYMEYLHPEQIIESNKKF